MPPFPRWENQLMRGIWVHVVTCTPLTLSADVLITATRYVWGRTSLRIPLKVIWED